MIYLDELLDMISAIMQEDETRQEIVGSQLQAEEKILEEKSSAFNTAICKSSFTALLTALTPSMGVSAPHWKEAASGSVFVPVPRFSGRSYWGLRQI